MKNIVITIIVIVLIIIGAVFVFKNKNADDVKLGDENTQNPTVVSGEGKVFFTITDAAADMKNVSEITMSVSKAEIHSEARGWVTVSNEEKDFNLLALKSKGELALYATSNVSADTYNQVRLTVKKVLVKDKAGKTSEAKLPSGMLKINTKVEIRDQATSTVKLDVLADKSLHTTGNGKYIFAPVLKVESRSEAHVDVSSGNKIVIHGGNVDANITVGMDVDGETKTDFILDSKAGIDIDAGGLIQLKGGSSSKVNATSTSGTIEIKTDAILNTN